MNFIETCIAGYEFYRNRTLDTLKRIEESADPAKLLGWRPGPGRAHVAWQLMHVGVTEEIFATERLAPHKAGAFQDLWPRFRGGSTPDDTIPSAEQIRGVLGEARAHLVETLREIPMAKLDEIVPALAQRKLTHRQVLFIIGWHEAHHQGQAHITLNLHAAAHGK